MKQVLIQGGRAVVRDMPAPQCGAGEVVVRAAYSVISTGTETAHLRESSGTSPGLWTRRLGKIGEAVHLAVERGPQAAANVVRDRMDGPCEVTGYSLAGTVVEVGSTVTDLVAGQRVACAGAAAAHHAEIVAVPRNLVVAVPQGLSLDRAAFVTLGAIALQGVRTADLRLGESACVLGLGLVGQLTVALLRASGCRVVGIDLSPGRVEAARALGLDRGFVPGRDDPEREIDHLTGSRGVDAVLLTAGTPSSEPIRQAVRLVRSRGRVVVVGAVGMEIDRAALYMKEAEIRISRSYGPGRYDPLYEERGIDYPYAHVRWTENRNMQAFLSLAGSGDLRLEALPVRAFPVSEAEQAYRLLSEGPEDERPLAAILRYPDADDAAPQRRIEVAPPPRRSSGIGVALVGPGSFASQVHLPNLATLGPVATLRAVVGRTANPARELARRWSADYATTDLDEVLRDDAIGLVLISTRHHLHAEQAARALDAGKAVFLEKPAALSEEGLQRLEQAVARASQPLIVGFNRRFSPDAIALGRMLLGRSGPLTAIYRVNAGRLPADHWALGPEGGGRLIGEACHMIDLLAHLVGHPRVDHRLQVLGPPAGRSDLAVGDNFALSVSYADGSVSELVYTSLGHPAAGKERLELHWDGKTAAIDDFRSLTVHGVSGAATRPEPDKGHGRLLGAFVEHACGRSPLPIGWDEIADVTRFTLRLDREARGGPGPQPPQD